MPWWASGEGVLVTRPNLRATQVELHDGLTAVSQNRWPSLALDIGQINGKFSRISARRLLLQDIHVAAELHWKHVYEPLIRRAAGLGVCAARARPGSVRQHFRSLRRARSRRRARRGLAAALGASESGANVLLCDEQMEIGGWLLSEPAVLIEGRPAWLWIDDVADQLAGAGSRASSLARRHSATSLTIS